MPIGRMYVIGERGAGVLIVKTNPFRTVVITDAVVTAYGVAQNIDAYAKIGAAAWGMIADVGTNPAVIANDDGIAAVEAMLSAGTQMSTADFVFTAEVADESWVGRRQRHAPLKIPFESIAPLSDAMPADGSLREAVLDD